MQAEAIRTGRSAWADVAKAACILLVVLFHAYDGEYRWVRWASAVPADAFWGGVNDALKSVRMPLFFLVSGFLAARSIGRSWRDVAHKRVYNLAFLYLLWAVILSFFFSIFRLLVATPDEPVVEKLLFILLGVSWAWYLGALPAFFLFARVTRRWPVWAPLGLAYCLAIAADLLSAHLPWSTASMMRSLLFFVIGVRLPTLLTAAADRAGRVKLLLPLAGLAAALPLAGTFTALAPAVPLMAAWAGVVATAMAARERRVVQAGSWLAARTLPIYLLHFPVLAVLGHAFRTAARDHLDSSLVAALFPLALTMAAVPISLLLHRLILAAGGHWLFALPELRMPRFGRERAIG